MLQITPPAQDALRCAAPDLEVHPREGDIVAIAGPAAIELEEDQPWK